MENIRPKDYSDTYLYSMSPQLEKKLFEFIMEATPLDKESESFMDLRDDLKRRQVTNNLVKVLDSKAIVLMHSKEPLPKAFKVFCATDVKYDKKKKVFVDCSEVLRIQENNRYTSRDIDILVAYMISAMNCRMYYAAPNICLNEGIIHEGAVAFSALFTHVVDYLNKISIVPATKAKCIYLSALYYITNILGKETTDRTKSLCRKISSISEREEEVLFLQLDENWNLNIKYFIQSVAKVLRLNKMTVEVFVEKWIFLYGTGTHFALELFPAFASMLTDAYVGCYINNQKTIEKVVGKSLVSFTRATFRIADNMMK